MKCLGVRGVVIPGVTLCSLETGISFGWMDQQARVQTYLSQCKCTCRCMCKTGQICMQVQECIFWFIVSCQVFSFSSSLVSFDSYQFCTCYIYLHIVYILFARNLFRQLSFLVCGTYSLVASVFIFSSFGFWSHSSCKFPGLFRFVIVQYFSLRTL